jgi:hypothetical protein
MRLCNVHTYFSRNDGLASLSFQMSLSPTAVESKTHLRKMNLLEWHRRNDSNEAIVTSVPQFISAPGFGGIFGSIALGEIS